MLPHVTLLIAVWGGHELGFLSMTVEWSPCFHPCLFVNVRRTQMKWQQWSTVHHVAPLFFLFRTRWSLENNTRKTRGLDKHFRPVILLYFKVMTCVQQHCSLCAYLLFLSKASWFLISTSSVSVTEEEGKTRLHSSRRGSFVNPIAVTEWPGGRAEGWRWRWYLTFISPAACPLCCSLTLISCYPCKPMPAAQGSGQIKHL